MEQQQPPRGLRIVIQGAGGGLDQRTQAVQCPPLKSEGDPALWGRCED